MAENTTIGFPELPIYSVLIEGKDFVIGTRLLDDGTYQDCRYPILSLKTYIGDGGGGNTPDLTGYLVTSDDPSIPTLQEILAGTPIDITDQQDITVTFPNQTPKYLFLCIPSGQPLKTWFTLDETNFGPLNDTGSAFRPSQSAHGYDIVESSAPLLIDIPFTFQETE